MERERETHTETQTTHTDRETEEERRREREREIEPLSAKEPVLNPMKEPKAEILVFKFLPWPGFEPRTSQSNDRERYHSTTAPPQFLIP